MDPDEARYNSFMTEVRKGLERAKQDELVQTYEDFRSFCGDRPPAERTVCRARNGTAHGVPCQAEGLISCRGSAA